MKAFKILLLLLVSSFAFVSASSQNTMINILTQKSGLVKKGNTVFLQVTVNNTDPALHIGIYKIKLQISIPSAIASIDSTGHVLPTGWIITSNDGSVITVSNGTDMIAAGIGRTILFAIRGKNTGGPSTITGSLSIANGKPPGTEPGTLPGDNTGDNISTSTIKVIK